MNVCVIIAAAGRSERFGDTDKLDQDLGGRPLLLRSVEVFAKRDEVSRIVVGAPPDRITEFREKYGPTLGFHGAQIVEGGRSGRWETVRKALAAVPESATHIAVHDAARPALFDDMLDRLFEAAQALPAVIPAISIDDTVKRVGREPIDVADHAEDAIADSILGDTGRQFLGARSVEGTIDRTGLVQAQTPQVFEADLLRRAYDQEDFSGATDEACLVERQGEPVYVVEGDKRNFKITTPEDVRLMRAVLGIKPPARRAAHKRF